MYCIELEINSDVVVIDLSYYAWDRIESQITNYQYDINTKLALQWTEKLAIVLFNLLFKLDSGRQPCFYSQ